MNAFDLRVKKETGAELHSCGIETLQVNVGFLCNNRCNHCHVNGGPDRREVMTWKTMRHIIGAARTLKPNLVDITGGAPEMNPNLKRLISALREEGLSVQVRTNLTILLEPGMESIIEFYKRSGVKIVASLPCYMEKEVDSQRGRGTFERSLKALKLLNEAGYGVEPGLVLDLVFNPESDFLPAEQAQLEREYREVLENDYGVVFDNLVTIANMPVGRFARMLRRKGVDRKYDRLLRRSFNPDTVDRLMCRRQLSVGWDGLLHDCDFNLALGIPIEIETPANIQAIEGASVARRRIATGIHCFGCTAGQGSSCGGALVR